MTSELSEVATNNLTTALSDELAKQGGGFLQGFLGCVSYIDAEGKPCWSFFTMEKQGVLITLGLKETIAILVDAQAAAAFLGDYEDEDEE